jgi:hypothetical protein
MTELTEGRASPVGPILAIGGGVVAAIGSFLTWLTVSAPGQFSNPNSGTDLGDGWITLVAGVLLVIAGLVILAGRSPAAVRAMAILAIVGGVVAAGDGLLNLATSRDQLAESVRTPNETQEAARRRVDVALDSGQVDLSAGIGLWMVTGGGIIGLVGGILGLTAARRAPTGATAAPPAPGGTLTGFADPQPAAPAPPPPPSGAGAGAGVPPPPPPQPEAPAPEQPASGAMGTPPPEEDAPPGDRRPPSSGP